MENKDIYELIYEDIIINYPVEAKDFEKFLEMGLYTKEEIVKLVVKSHPLLKDIKA